MNKKVVKLLNKYTFDTDSKKASQKGETKVRRKRMLVFGLSMFFLMLVLISVGIHQKYENRDFEQKIAETEKILDERNEAHASLEQEIEQLNDDDYIRRIARSKFFMSESGETVFSLPKAKENNQPKAENEHAQTNKEEKTDEK